MVAARDGDPVSTVSGVLIQNLDRDPKVAVRIEELAGR
jgi:hypothetical protein